MTEQRWNDPIVEEVRKAREEHAAKFDYDLHRIFADLKRRENRSEREVVSLPPKRIEPVGRTRG